MSEKISIENMVASRKARGMELLENGVQPQEVNKQTWVIPSSDNSTTYTIEYDYDEYRCTCPDFFYRGVPCKHINAVKVWKTLKNRFVQHRLKIQQHYTPKVETIEVSCKFCHSNDVIKYGTKNGKQNYMCKECNRKFVNNVDFENMKYDPNIIALTLNLYFKGVSLRKISHHLKQFHKLNVSYKTVHNWINKYITIMNNYVNTLQAEVGNTWHTNEMMVNVGGTWEYLWNVMDEETRFQLASIVSTERKVADARNVFKAAKKQAGGRKPKYVVTDGLPSYNRAVKKEFITKTRETTHIRGVGLRHQHNNNHVERLHGTMREREKTMRAMKTEDTPIIDGHRLYYNFIRPHMALNGLTPSEMAGITIDGDDNKWMNLMKKAIEHQKQVKASQ